MKIVGKLKRLSGSWYFLVIVIVVYLLFSMFSIEIYLNSLEVFSQIIYKIIPIFIMVLHC